MLQVLGRWSGLLVTGSGMMSSMSWSVLVGEHGITKRIRGCWGFCWGGHHRQCGQGRWDAPGSQVSVTAMRGIGAFSAYLWVA